MLSGEWYRFNRMAKNQRWKTRAPNFPPMIKGEEPWGNGCECFGCGNSGNHVAECFDGVVRELCTLHYMSRNLIDVQTKHISRKL